MPVMNRREFLGAMAVAPLAIGTQPANPVRRTFEITTRIELPEEHDAALAWVPLPLGRPAPYQTDRGHTLGGNADRSRVVKLPGSGTAVAVAEWGHMMPAPVFVVTARVETSEPPGPALAIERRDTPAGSGRVPEAGRPDSPRWHRQGNRRRHYARASHAARTGAGDL